MGVSFLGSYPLDSEMTHFFFSIFMDNSDSASYSYAIPSWESQDRKCVIPEKKIASRFGMIREIDMSRNVGGEVEMGVVDCEGIRVDVRDHLTDINMLLPLDAALTEEVSPHVTEQNLVPGNLDTYFRNYITAQHAALTAAEKNNITLLPVGMIPGKDYNASREALWSKITSHYNPHYRYLAHRDGKHLETLESLSAYQVHIQQFNGEAAVGITRGLSMIAPYLAALAASSPIINGEYHGCKSERLKKKWSMPFSGTPPAEALVSFISLRRYLDEKVPLMRTVAPGYYDVRLPRVEIGTVETCVMDMSPDVDCLFTLTALIDAVGAKIAQCIETEEELPIQFFGANTLDMNERKWIIESHRRLLSSFRLYNESVKTPNGITTQVSALLRDLIQWSNGGEKLLSQTDDLCYRGSVAERMVSDMDLTRVYDMPVVVDAHIVQDTYTKYAHEYKNRIASLFLQYATR